MQKTPWRVIAEALAAEGVSRIFGMPGNPLHLVADIAEATDIPIVLTRHEHSGVACAYAAARITGQPQVAFGNPGPGITNMTTGMLEAHSASLPVICLSNGVPMGQDGQGAFQELDSVALMRPVTKWATRIVDPATTSWVMARAFQVAMSGRPGPVFIDVPSDIGLALAQIPPYVPAEQPRRSRPDPTDVEQAAALLSTARQPILWCGSGAYSSGAGAAVMALAERTGAAIMTTPGGRSVVAEDHPLCLGQTGLYFTKAGKDYFDGADLMVSIGSRLEDFSTGGWRYWPEGARLVQIDIDPHAIALNQRPAAAMVGDASLALDDLIAAVSVDAAEASRRCDAISAAQTDYVAWVEADAFEHHTPIRARHAVAAINRVFGKDTIMVHENGGADLWSYYWPYYRVLDAGDDIPMGEQTAMGMGIIGTVGAKLARPEKQVVCVSGDGAAQMAMMEFATAAEQKCGVTWLVLNNQA
ncbi:MAG: thiamine pyrophosphate-binding protein, partial [Rhodospirillaceae bacterium]|nr:thiamine pyrophosphate-binding protein [Rhodospirillaceae bacterium]